MWDETGERERERERERDLDLSHLCFFSKGFSLAGPSPRILKIIGEKHAGNL